MNVEQHVQENLLPGTVYHYRVVAVSEIEPGKIKDFDGSEATFTTLPPAAGSPPSPTTASTSWSHRRTSTARWSNRSRLWGDPGLRGRRSVHVHHLRADRIPAAGQHQRLADPRHARRGWLVRPGHRDALKPRTGISLGNGQEYQFFSSDLSRALVEPSRVHHVSRVKKPRPCTRRYALLRARLHLPASATCYTPLLTTTGRDLRRQVRRRGYLKEGRGPRGRGPS